MFHKITGKLIVIYSLAHTIVHMGNLYENVLYKPLKFLRANGIEPNEYVINSDLSWTDWLFTIKPQYFGLVPGYAGRYHISYNHQVFYFIHSTIISHTVSWS